MTNNSLGAFHAKDKSRVKIDEMLISDQYTSSENVQYLSPQPRTKQKTYFQKILYAPSLKPEKSRNRWNTQIASKFCTSKKNRHTCAGDELT